MPVPLVEDLVVKYGSNIKFISSRFIPPALSSILITVYSFPVFILKIISGSLIFLDIKTSFAVFVCIAL